jgi:hypothetical protein
VKIPAATAIFHNIIRSQHGDEEWLDHEDEDLIPVANHVDLPNGDDNHQGHNLAGNNLRDQIAMQMWNDFQHD